MEEPLIYTTKGNVPIASLAYSTSWEDRPDSITFVEEYRDGEEIVKRAVHVLSKVGVTGDAVIGQIG